MTKTKKANIASSNAGLQQHIDKHHFLRFNRVFNGKEDNLNGFLLQLSAGFLLLQSNKDFRLDGYCIFPMDAFDSYRYSRYERAFKQIFKGEGIYPQDYGIDTDINLSDWATIFRQLKKRDYHVIVECEDPENLGYYIGSISRVNWQSVVLQFYDATGKLEERPDVVKFTNIKLVTFGDRYTTVFRKYLKLPKRK